jgi:hypothetical protein
MCQSHVGCGTRLGAADAEFIDRRLRTCGMESVQKLTWLASCVRRILRQLILAVAEERRVYGSAKGPCGFEVGGQ